MEPMKLFSRNKQTDTGLPPEVQAYTQAEHRERVGMAWLVGIISLLVSLLILAGLFFGGRWVYRKITKNDKPVPVVTDTDKKNEGHGHVGDEGSSTTNDNNQNSGNNQPANPAPSSNTPAPTQQPVTGDQGANLPNTGPDIDL
jgi:hypothetical protein